MNYKGLELDRFQKEALDGIDRDNSVLVAAPTGAGKTVIAEYAIDKQMKENRRVIYTAPIKALSNQKFRDLSAQYGEQVGIITGDIVLNQYAPIIMMTTEVFRNTIFDNITRLENVGCVILDEVHYINHIERGTVWEESIIFAPQHIRFVCLSATIPNISQVAKWMRSVRTIPIEEIVEHKRPVPLEHKLYIEGYGVGTLSDLNAIRNNSHDNLAHHPPTELITHIDRAGQLPCLYFCFSRKRCQQHAESYWETYNFLSESQESKIVEEYDRLCKLYGIQKSKNAIEFRKLIAKGIAYHHAGMLPTLKEVVERLFTLGLVQLLFTTETFAVGINMPACSVVFNTLEKYDGISFRYLKTREFQQMAGRAGRRGLDEIGFVYSKVSPRFTDPNEVKRITVKEVEPIESQFNLAYSGVLNLYAKHGDAIHEVCTQSLSNYQNVRRVDRIGKQIAKASKNLAELPSMECVVDANLEIYAQIESHKQLQQKTEIRIASHRENRKILQLENRGRRKSQKFHKKLARIDRKIGNIRAQAEMHKCANCPQFADCEPFYRNTKKYNRQLKHLKIKKEHFTNYQRKQVDTRLEILRKLDYIDQEGLLSRGVIAEKIYGYEMQLTELLFAGFFEELDEDQINLLMMSIVCEQRGERIFYEKLKNKKLIRMLEDAEKAIDRVRAVEVAYPELGGVTPKLNSVLSSSILAWSKGCNFDQLSNYAQLSDGDFVRTFRLVIDLLRQLQRATSHRRAVSEKLKRCVIRINRDVVDAERQLRIGQNL